MNCSNARPSKRIWQNEPSGHAFIQALSRPFSDIPRLYHPELNNMSGACLLHAALMTVVVVPFALDHVADEADLCWFTSAPFSSR